MEVLIESLNCSYTIDRVYRVALTFYTNEFLVSNACCQFFFKIWVLAWPCWVILRIYMPLLNCERSSFNF